ncbi:GNAT family N-acetyltransferase, partial [Pseudomonas sp. FW306-2-11AD]
MGHESVVTKLSRAPWPYREEDARDFLTRPRATTDVLMLITSLESGTPEIIGG